MKKLILTAYIILLSGCGTSGVVNPSLIGTSIPANYSRIIVSRDNSLMYLAGTADISFNGRKIASLARGGTVIEDAPAGRQTFNITVPTAPGSYGLHLETKAGKTYVFEVSPNEGKSMIPGMLFGIVGDAIDGDGYFQIVLKEVK